MTRRADEQGKKNSKTWGEYPWFRRLRAIGVALLSTLACTLAAALPPNKIASLARGAAMNATGNATLKDGITTSASVPISNGRAAWTGALATGVHKLTASRDRDGAASQPIFCSAMQ